MFKTENYEIVFDSETVDAGNENQLRQYISDLRSAMTYVDDEGKELAGKLTQIHRISDMLTKEHSEAKYNLQKCIVRDVDPGIRLISS